MTFAKILKLSFIQDDQDLARERQTAVRQLPGAMIIDLDQTVAIETAKTRAAAKLKLPDAAIIACARSANAFAIIGNDRRWENRSLGIPYIHLDDIAEQAMRLISARRSRREERQAYRSLFG